MRVNLANYTREPERSIAKAARMSHQSESKGLEDDRRLIRTLIKHQHLSPIEFADATFKVEAISRSCLAQLTRHRLVSYSVHSLRYTPAEDYPIIPGSFDSLSKSHLRKIQNLINEQLEVYQTLIQEADIPKEDARFLLPLGTKTNVYLKTNFREYRHIIDLRCQRSAQWEIRDLATRILRLLNEIAPSVFEDLVEKYL